jgi:tetratricopeptide (TPR) repeat protein
MNTGLQGSNLVFVVLLCGFLSSFRNFGATGKSSGNDFVRGSTHFGMSASPHSEAWGLGSHSGAFQAHSDGSTDDKNGPADTMSESFEELAARAQAAMEADRVPEAIRLYIRGTTLRPSWAEGWWHLGTLLFDAGHFRDARDAFAQFVTIERNQPGPGFGMLGLSEFHLKHYAMALSALERGVHLGLGSNPDFTRSVLYHDAILNALLRKPEIALQRLTLIANQTAAAHPEASRDSVLSDMELLDAFGTAALRLAKLPSEVPVSAAPLVRKVGHAQALVALQDRVAAEAEFKESVAIFGSEPGVHYAYGVFLLKEHPPLAIDEFHREIEISPSHDGARIQLALEFLRTADYEQGLKYAREAVALAPENFVTHVACGRLWLALEKPERAVQELRMAVKLAPGSPDAHFALSQALSQAGQQAQSARERAEFQRLKALSDAANR